MNNQKFFLILCFLLIAVLVGVIGVSASIDIQNQNQINFTSLREDQYATPTNAWRESVVVENFVLNREERYENRLNAHKGFDYKLSPNKRYGLIFLANNVCELWHFDEDEIATYVATFYDVYNGKFSPDSSKFALLNIDDTLDVYDANGYLLSNFDEKLINSKDIKYLRFQKYQFSKNGEFILLINNNEGIHIYRTTGYDIPNMYFVSFDEEDEIPQIQERFLRKNSYVLDESIAREMMKNLEHSVFHGEEVLEFASNKEYVFESGNYYSSTDSYGYDQHDHYYIPILDFSSHDEYALFYDFNSFEIFVWSFIDEEIVRVIDTTIDQNINKENGHWYYDFFELYLDTTRVYDYLGESYVFYTDKIGVHIVSIENGEETLLSHFENFDKENLIEFKVLENNNRVITVGAGVLKIWTIDGKLLEVINDDYRIGSVVSVSPNEKFVAIEKCFEYTYGIYNKQCNLSILSSSTGSFEITISNPDLEPVLENDDSIINDISSISSDLFQYYIDDSIYPTIQYNLLSQSTYISFNQDSSKLFFSSRWTDQKPGIYDLKKNTISILPVTQVRMADFDEDFERIAVSGASNIAGDSVTVYDFDGNLLDILKEKEGSFLEGEMLYDGRIITSVYDVKTYLSVWKTHEGFPYDWQGIRGLTAIFNLNPIVTSTITPSPTSTPTASATQTLVPTYFPTAKKTSQYTRVPTSTPFYTITPTPKVGERIWPDNNILLYEPRDVVNINGEYSKSVVSNDFKNILVNYSTLVNNEWVSQVAMFDFNGNQTNEYDLLRPYEGINFEINLDFFDFSMDKKYYMIGDSLGKIQVFNIDGSVRFTIDNFLNDDCNYENWKIRYSTFDMKEAVFLDPWFDLENVFYKDVCSVSDEESQDVFGAFSNDNSKIATSYGNLLKIWTIDGDLITSFENYINTIVDIKFSPDDNYVIFSAGRSVYVFDIANGEIVFSFDRHLVDGITFDFVFDLSDFDGYDVDMSSDGLSSSFINWGVASIDKNNNVFIWDFNGNVLLEINSTALYKPRTIIPLMGDDKFIIQNSIDAIVWEENGENPLFIFDDHEELIYNINLHENKRWLATAGWDGLVKIWDIQTGELLSTLEFHDSYVDSVMFVDGTNELITISRDGKIVKWILSE